MGNSLLLDGNAAAAIFLPNITAVGGGSSVDSNVVLLDPPLSKIFILSLFNGAFNCFVCVASNDLWIMNW
jgi:energy-converting hydrogenase Eha subunit C